MDITPTYVAKLKEYLRREWEGYHTKFKEVEDLRYYEDTIALREEERTSGISFRSGLTGELIENVKSALTTNKPVVKITPGKKTPKGQVNSSKREKFWNAWLTHISRPVNILNRLVDAQAMSIGILKASYHAPPSADRKRRRDEERDPYLERQEALKRVWGPPFKVSDIHPLTYFPALGAGNIPEEIIEVSWKSRRSVYEAFGMENFDPSTAKVDSEGLISGGGLPGAYIRGLPAGTDTSMMVEVTEYWSPTAYQVYLDEVGRNGPVYEMKDPPIKYFMALGRTTSSRDPDKFSLSIAEYLRHNEPIINRTITRMAEAAELIVQKRLVVELAEGSFDEFTETTEGDNEPDRTSIDLEPGKMKMIPAGSRVIDPFAGAEHVYDAMPMVQLAMELAGRHGVSPIFKGVSSGAGASGYKDNSLYLMAMAQFLYVRDAYQECLRELVQWAEFQTVHTVKQDIFLDEYELSVNDIRDFPATVSVDLEPYLPQDTFRDTQLLDQLHSRGIVTSRMVLTEGLKKGQPEEIEDDIMKEELRNVLKPILYRDVLTEVGLKLPEQAEAETGLVDEQGKPLSSGQANGGGSPLGQEFSGARSGAAPRTPSQEPGTVA